jgi:hypothetical protein
VASGNSFSPGGAAALSGFDTYYWRYCTVLYYSAEIVHLRYNQSRNTVPTGLLAERSSSSNPIKSHQIPSRQRARRFLPGTTSGWLEFARQDESAKLFFELLLHEASSSVSLCEAEKREFLHLLYIFCF